MALAAHEGQRRKGEPTPYVSHPFHVALMLGRVGADEVTIQAALLHDVVEDCDGWTDERVRAEFGEDVADVVAQVTEPKGESWEVRKKWALDGVASLSDRALLVKASDKLHNLRSLVAKLDGASDPAEVWKPFSRGPEVTIRHAGKIVAALRDRLAAHAEAAPLADGLGEAFAAFEAHLPA